MVGLERADHRLDRLVGVGVLLEEQLLVVADHPATERRTNDLAATVAVPELVDRLATRHPPTGAMRDRTKPALCARALHDPRRRAAAAEHDRQRRGRRRRRALAVDPGAGTGDSLVSDVIVRHIE